MEELLKIQDDILRLQTQIKKNRKYSKETKEKKIYELLAHKNQFRTILEENKFNFNETDFIALVERYKTLKIIINESLELLSGNIEGDSTDSDKEKTKMPEKLDVSLAIKLVDKYEGDPVRLLNFIESVNLLKQYSTGVPEADIIGFIKTRLIGPAHGAIEGLATVKEVADSLKLKFGIKITPKAIEKEMLAFKQGKKTISEYGNEMNSLAAKLAAAHVSQGTFENEAAAAPIVQPIAVNAFATGLRDTQTAFFIKARNPSNLTKAISDALEVAPIPSATPENALWISGSNRYSNQPSYYRPKYNRFKNTFDNFYKSRKNPNNFKTQNSNYDRRFNSNPGYNSNNLNYESYQRNKYNNRPNYVHKGRRDQVNFVSSDPNTDRQNSNKQYITSFLPKNQNEINTDTNLFRTLNEQCD